MNPGHDQRVRDLFEAAVDAPANDRDQLLAAASGNTTRIEVTELLRAHDQSEGFLEPARGPSPALNIQGTRIGRYTLVRLIGAGGMGAVYEALQDRPKRTVALKLLRAHLPSAASIRRFEHESQVLALLQHPAIAQVYEAGTHDDAAPYFAMEYVQGARTIVEHAHAANLSLRDKLALFARVCDAVQFAHLRGVIHRDLKPANILIDDQGNPKVIDFGIARIADADLTAATLETGIGQLIGTLRYMSPEQCAGDPRQIDTRSDVYTLGVVLFELLTGRMPYDLGTTSITHAPRIIREQPPTRPSTVLTILRGDVETIVLKALVKDRAARYQSAGEFAADIRRFLDNQPILASPPSAVTTLRLFARRHRTFVTAAALVIFALAIGLVASLWQANRASNAANTARRQAYISDIAAAQAALASEDGAALRRFLDRADPDLRGWEWRFLDALSDTSHAIMGLESRAARVAMALNDRPLVLTEQGGLFLFDGPELHWFKELTRIDDNSPCLALNNAHTRCAVAGTGTVEIWNLDPPALERKLSFDPVAGFAFRFSPDDRYLALGCFNGTLYVWDLHSDAPPRVVNTGPTRVSALAFSSDSAQLAIATWSNKLRLLDIQTLADHAAWDLPSLTNNICFARSDQTMIIATIDGQIVFFDLGAGRVDQIINAHASEIETMDLSQDARTLLTTSADSTVRVWDTTTGERIDRFRGHANTVYRGALARNADWAVSCDSGAYLRTWRVSRTSLSRMSDSNWIEHLDFSFDGTRIAAAESERASIIDAQTLKTIVSFPLPKAFAASAGFNDDATLMAARGGSGDTFVFDTTTAAQVARFPSPVEFNEHARGAMAWLSPTEILDAVPDVPLRIDDIRDPTHPLEIADAAPWAGVAVAKDRFAAVTLSGAITIFNSATRRPMLSTTLDHRFTRAAALSPDARTLAVGTSAGKVLLIDARTGRVRRVLDAHATAVLSLVFTPDGKRLASGGGWDHTLRLWDPDTGDELLAFRGEGFWAIALAFSPDASRLAIGPAAPALRVYNINRRSSP